MDLNDLRSIVTAISFVIFAVIATWAWLPSRREDFADAAQLPFHDEGDLQ